MSATSRKTYINPAFHRHKAAAAIVGRILAAFGELEYLLTNMAGNAIDNKENVLRALYRLRATSSRIEVADTLMRGAFTTANLNTEYTAMLQAIWYCHKIRNQYAHCNWADDPRHAGLFFTDLQDSAKADTGFSHNWKHISVSLLKRQEAYFVYTQDWLHYMHEELALRVGKLSFHPWPKPKVQAQPLPHNSGIQQIPPWLTADQKAWHLARARAAQRGPPTPTPAQRALDQAREMKRSKKRAHREKSAKWSSSQK
jgi:hypothetical protein